MDGDGSASRQLSDFSSVEGRKEFEHFLISLGATKFGDWYKMPSVDQTHAGINKTWQLGGVCYDLNYRTSGEGILHIL